MKHYMLAALITAALVSGCAGGGGNKNTADVVEEDSRAELPVLKVYNMGGVPDGIMQHLVERLGAVYENTEPAGNLSLVDSAHIDNDRKGNDRYWFRILNNDVTKKTDTRREIALVVVNAEVCNYTKAGSHANLGISMRGRRISFVSYRRLKVNGLDDTDNLLKVSVHELGHSVGALVAGHKELRMHCPDDKCLMRDACNGYPYRNVNSFCHKCDSVMQKHGFNTANLGL